MSQTVDHAIVNVLVVQENSFLLVEEGKPGREGLFNFPGGHVEANETLFEAAIREAQEETGYQVELTGVVGIYQAIYDHLNISGPLFSARVIGGQARPSAEHPSSKWVTQDELLNLAKEGKLFTKYPPSAVEHYLTRGALPLDIVASYNYSRNRFKKAAIFDFNGVIVDDYLLQKEAWSQISQKIRGRAVTDNEMVQAIRGIPTKDIIRWMADGRLPEDEVEALTQQKTSFTRELFNKSQFMQLAPGLAGFLDDLKQKDIPRTIATSQSREVFDYLFDQLKLEQWFDKVQVICHDGTYPGKPAPDAYIKAAQVLHVDPRQCVVFEDAQSGIQSAYDAGVRTIIAIGRADQHQRLRQLPGVVQAVSDFTALHVSELFS